MHVALEWPAEQQPARVKDATTECNARNRSTKKTHRSKTVKVDIQEEKDRNRDTMTGK